MATSVTFNGVSYSIPAVGEESWGESLSNFFIAIPQGALQKTGGTFLLTADVNFGANYGLLSKYFTTRSSNPAATGVFRMAVTDLMSWRNNANTGNLPLGVNASDQLTFNGSAVYTGGITQLTTDVTATGPGSVAATVVQVGGYSAANVAAGAARANAAASGADPGTIVIRSNTGTFAGTLNGAATGNTTYTANQYGVVLSGNTNAMSVLAPDSSTKKVLVSGGSSANPSWQTIDSSALSFATFGTSPNASGASISAGVITLQPADGSNPGGVTAGAQTIGGIKTFSSAPVMSALSASQVVVTDSGKALASLVYTSGNTASSIIQRDGSGNFVAATGTFNKLAVTGLTASQAVVTDSSKLLSSLSYISTATASTLVSRDSNANTNSNNISCNYATTVTAAGTTTLTVASGKNQFFTGSSSQNILLPDATTLPQAGFQFFIVNNSSAAVTLRNSASGTLQNLSANTFSTITATSIGASSGPWDVQSASTNAGGGTVTSVAVSGVNGLSFTATPITTSGTIVASMTAPTRQIFFAGATGTYTRPSPIPLYLKVTVVGGGGAGGNSGGGANSGAAGGGGGGGTSITWISNPASSYTYFAGASGVSAGNGGLSNFGNLCVASGGVAGTAAGVSAAGTAGGAPGTGTVGNILIGGGNGEPGDNTIAGVLYGNGGGGGNSTLGGGGGGNTSNLVGTAGNNYGGGGQGGSGLSNGGNGAPGIIIVEEYYL